MEQEENKDLALENQEIIENQAENQELETSVEIADDTEDAEISFEDLGLDEQTLTAIERKGFKVPSPIQVLAIPRLLNGEANIIAKARTGTGKTAAFGLPLIQKLREKKDCVRAVVLEPTRELAVQTCTELQSFTEGKVPRTCVLYGGASYATQIRDLKRGAEIVVGTPGRIQDHIERGTLDLSKIEYFILDEGDEMLDMGFIDDIENIFQNANSESRILLFSATMPEPILKIAGKFMGDYEVVEEEGVIDEPLLIDQKYWVLRESEKIEALVRLIDIADDFYGLVFTQTKMDADTVSKALDERGYEAAALHGDIAQTQREKILARFRNKKTRILVATDVAARGIDISGLSHVVNYSLPFDGATYVHRIGRTGRAGSTGEAVTFVCPNEIRKLGFLQRAVRKASKGEMIESEIPSVDNVLEKKRTYLFDQLKQDLENQKSEEIPEQFVKMAQELYENDSAENVLASLLAVTYGKKLDKSRYGKIHAVNKGDSSDQLRLYIQLGRRDGYNPRRVADYFSSLLHIPGRLVDRIDISSNFTLVSLPKNMARKALELSKSNSKIPHMHIDIKEGGRRDFDFDDRSRKGGKNFGGKRRSESFSSERRNPKDADKNRSGKSKGNRPNFHTPTERSGSAGLYKKKSAKAERF